MAEIPTGGILINNVAYPSQYLNITANKDGEILIGYPNKSESVNEIWLLKSLGDAAYNLVGFVDRDKDEKDLDSPMNVYVGPADADPDASLEGKTLRASSTDPAAVFYFHYVAQLKAWQIFLYHTEGMTPYYLTLENDNSTVVKLYENRKEENQLWKFTAISRDLPTPGKPGDDEPGDGKPDDGTCPGRASGTNMHANICRHA
ncbi:hypothetical protein Clacol_005181 [Clathrus columnatus]|uniref:Ricin B lectin domain-containing protein n=1 Tax=Clathrus columnatus TaxID=1419009 RepID=A0AAV5A8J5_9AGAM|nr:hypothetical protein Clacol_005181 [Clathrus columnatus]